MKRSLLVMTAVIVFSLLLVTGAFATTTRCVNVTGSGGCFSTIQSAVNASAEGDIVSVYPGVYFERVYIATAGLTLMGTASAHGGTGTVIDAFDYLKGVALPNPPVGNSGIYVDNVDRVTIKNLAVRNAPHTSAPNGYNIEIYGNYATINNVQSLLSYYAGIYIDGDHATVMNCFSAGHDDEGVYIDGDYATVKYNTISGNESDGIYVDGGYPTVINNVITLADGECIDLENANYAVVTGNKVSDCESTGIYVADGSNVTVSNNVIRNAESECLEFSDVGDSTISSNDIAFCDEYGIYNCDTGYNNNKYLNNTVNYIFDGYESYYICDDNPTITGNKGSYNDDESIFFVECNSTCTGGTFSNNYASHANDGYYGFYLESDRLMISGNIAEYNSYSGFYIYYYSDGLNTVTKNISRYNGYGDNAYGGFEIYSADTTVSYNQALNNNGFGFYIEEDNVIVNNNIANNNIGTGIELYDGGSNYTMTLSNNTVKNNVAEGIATDNTGASSVISVTNNLSQGNRLDVCKVAGSLDATTFTGNIFTTGGKDVSCDVTD